MFQRDDLKTSDNAFGRCAYIDYARVVGPDPSSSLEESSVKPTGTGDRSYDPGDKSWAVLIPRSDPSPWSVFDIHKIGVLGWDHVNPESFSI